MRSFHCGKYIYVLHWLWKHCNGAQENENRNALLINGKFVIIKIFMKILQNDQLMNCQNEFS